MIYKNKNGLIWFSSLIKYVNNQISYLKQYIYAQSLYFIDIVFNNYTFLFSCDSKKIMNVFALKKKEFIIV